MNRARKEGVRIYVEFPVLNGKEYLEAHPEACPITDKGERAGPADSFMGICPTDPGFRSDRQKALASLLSAYAVDGIWLDYFHWHAQFERPDPILPETCFCERCLHLFENFASLKGWAEPPYFPMEEHDFSFKKKIWFFECPNRLW